MRIIAISDIHEKWNDIDLPDGDVLVIAGDLCERQDASFKAADAWVASLLPRYDRVLYVPGNHDGRITREPMKFDNIAPNLLNIMLVDQTIDLDGLQLHAMAWDFGERTAPESLIPHNLDILVTHEPAEGILDWSPRARDDRLGNRLLRKRISEVTPRLHVFGHCHAAYGFEKNDTTIFVNVAICGDPKKYYRAAHPATIIDIDNNDIISVIQWR
jgi:Icc-related predicted phosphoesterase